MATAPVYNAGDNKDIARRIAGLNLQGDRAPVTTDTIATKLGAPIGQKAPARTTETQSVPTTTQPVATQPTTTTAPTPSISDDEREMYQKQIAEAQKKAADMQKTAEGISQQASEAITKRTADQQQQFDLLSQHLGKNFEQFSTAINKVEQERGVTLQVDDKLATQAKNIIDKIKDPEEQKRALEQLANVNINMQRETGKEVPVQQGLTVPEQQEITAKETGIVETPKQVAVTNQIKDQKAINTDNFIKNPLASLNIDNIDYKILSNNQSNSADILATELKIQMQSLGSEDLPAYKDLENYYTKQGTKITENTKDQLFLLEKIYRDNVNNAEQAKQLAEQQFNSARQSIEASKSANIDELSDERARMEAYTKAQLAFSGVPAGSSYNINKMLATTTKYDKMISQVESNYSQQLQDLNIQETKMYLDYSKQLTDLGNTFAMDSLGILTTAQKDISMIEKDSLLLKVEKDEKMQARKEQITSDMLAGLAKYRSQQDAIDKEKLIAQQNVQKAKFESAGIAYAVNEKGDIVTFEDPETGKPMLTWERQKEINNMIMDESKFNFQKEQFKADENYKWTKFDYDKEKDEIDNYYRKQTFILDQKYKEGQISQQEYSKKIAQANALKDTVYADIANQSIANEFIAETGLQLDGGRAYSDGLINSSKQIATGEIVSQNINNNNISLDAIAIQTVPSIADQFSKMGINFKVSGGTGTYRDSASQNALFAKGASRAKGGESNHNLGMAMDLHPMFNGNKESEKQIVDVMNQNGWYQVKSLLGWDRGHFEYRGVQSPIIMKKESQDDREVESWVNSVNEGRANISNVPDNIRSKVNLGIDEKARAESEKEYPSLTKKQRDEAQSLRKEINSDKKYSNMIDIKNGFDTVNSLYQGKTAEANGFDDIAAINAFQRMVDPGATVREGDISLLQTAIPYFERISPDFQWQKFTKGDKLPPNIREALLNAANDIYKEKAINYNTTVGERMEKIAEQSGIPFELIGEKFDISDNIDKDNLINRIKSPLYKDFETIEVYNDINYLLDNYPDASVDDLIDSISEEKGLSKEDAKKYLIEYSNYNKTY